MIGFSRENLIACLLGLWDIQSSLGIFFFVFFSPQLQDRLISREVHVCRHRRSISKEGIHPLDLEKQKQASGIILRLDAGTPRFWFSKRYRLTGDEQGESIADTIEQTEDKKGLMIRTIRSEDSFKKNKHLTSSSI